MPLRAYRADTLDAVLEDRTRAYINNAAYGLISNGISVIFHCFRRDFTLSAGSVQRFIDGYLETDISYGIERPLRFEWRVR